MSLSRIFPLALLLSAPQVAAAVPAYTFTSPDFALPVEAGTGLAASVWTGVDVDTLAAAEAYMAATPAAATFDASLVDYPAGPAGVVDTGTSFGAALGADSSSLSDPGIAADPVLNSILLFEGWLRVDIPGSQLLGVASDDGSDLAIQGTQVIANDGIHAFRGQEPARSRSPSPRRGFTRSTSCSSSRTRSAGAWNFSKARLPPEPRCRKGASTARRRRPWCHCRQGCRFWRWR